MSDGFVQLQAHADVSVPSLFKQIRLTLMFDRPALIHAFLTYNISTENRMLE